MTNIYFWGKIISPSFQTSQETQQSPIQSLHTDQLIKTVQCGAQNAFLLTNNNELYACGSNLEGQIGLSFNPNRYLEISRIFVPTKTQIVLISCGWYHTLILDQIGCVYSSGKGSEGAHGQGTKQNSYGFKQIMAGVKKISAGLDHSLAIKGNKVFGWGNTEQGQLGMHSKKKFLSPQELNVYPCSEIFAGPKYSIFVTVKGVYGCGMNNNYQLGLGHDRNLHYPKNLNVNDFIVKIWGGNYCFSQNKLGQVYVWGTGAFGVFKFPTKIQLFKGCDQISLGLNFGIVSKNERIYVWGCNNFGQLGNENTEMRDYAYESLKLSRLDLSSFSCGRNFSIGISYGEQINMKTQFPKDQIMQDFDGSEDLEFRDNLIKQSSYSNFQYPFSLKENVNIFKESAKQRQKRNNRYQAASRIDKSKNKQSYKQGLMKSQNQKALSDHTVKKMMSIAQLNKKRYPKKDSQKFEENDLNNIDRVVQQLSELKYKMQQNSKRNRVLADENKYLKHYIRQSLQKQNCSGQNESSQSDDLQDDKQNLSNIEKLKNKLKSQQSRITQIEKDDDSSRKSAENRRSRKNLPIRRERMSQSGEDQQDEQVEFFGSKLQKLKSLLQEAVNNNYNQSSQNTDNY